MCNWGSTQIETRREAGDEHVIQPLKQAAGHPHTYQHKGYLAREHMIRRDTCMRVAYSSRPSSCYMHSKAGAVLGKAAPPNANP